MFHDQDPIDRIEYHLRRTDKYFNACAQCADGGDLGIYLFIWSDQHYKFCYIHVNCSIILVQFSADLKFSCQK